MNIQTEIDFSRGRKLAKKDVPPGRLEKRSDGWWITGFTGNPNDDCGPYSGRGAREEADDDRMGLYRFWKHNRDLFQEACDG